MASNDSQEMYFITERPEGAPIEEARWNSSPCCQCPTVATSATAIYCYCLDCKHSIMLNYPGVPYEGVEFGVDPRWKLTWVSETIDLADPWSR